MLYHLLLRTIFEWLFGNAVKLDEVSQPKSRVSLTSMSFTRNVDQYIHYKSLLFVNTMVDGAFWSVMEETHSVGGSRVETLVIVGDEGRRAEGCLWLGQPNIEHSLKGSHCSSKVLLL
jgi:hypothetical protein